MAPGKRRKLRRKRFQRHVGAISKEIHPLCPFTCCRLWLGRILPGVAIQTKAGCRTAASRAMGFGAKGSRLPNTRSRGSTTRRSALFRCDFTRIIGFLCVCLVCGAMKAQGHRDLTRVAKYGLEKFKAVVHFARHLGCEALGTVNAIKAI